ncbi:DUF4149 domain-containing protein [Candidatus Woesearchaeota archaeon]|nr:DUF4149 domain-containing protein [Candidatus Woesearchaeota archaeon]
MQNLSLSSKIIIASIILSLTLGLWEAWYQGFIMTPIVFVFLLALPLFILSLFLYCIILLISISKKYKSKLNKFKKILLIILTICSIFIIIPLIIVKLTNKINSLRAQGIIDAINLYKQQNGEYPDDLHKLVPNYLSDIPKNLWNDQFRYEIVNFHEVWNEEEYKWEKLNVTQFRLKNSIGSGWYTQVYDSYDDVWFLWD